MTFLKNTRDRINADYAELVKEFPELLKEPEKLMETLSPEESLALRYLYISMPVSDMANYVCEVFMDSVKQGVWLWKNLKSVQELPDEIYLNYVLLHRVNEEEIRPCRELFGRDIIEKISQGSVEKLGSLSTEEIILETNFWCAEHVTYHCGDDRTLSALAVYNRGYGRCGEESVFTINALRSVGIPARQVYAPRWSHCDDNHAWVEAWCDGKWVFLGACEPEMILNRGWFTAASSRAMMIHSRMFGYETADEKEAGQEGMVHLYNQLSRYAATHEVTVTVVDTEGTAVENASIEFCVLNYSEYSPAALAVTDAQGKAVLETGYGSLYVQVEKDGVYTGKAFHCEKESELTVVLGDTSENGDIDMFAPVDTPVNTAVPSKEQKEECKRRTALADKLRTERSENWENPERIAFLAQKEPGEKWRKPLLDILSDKDQTDLKQSVLEEHLKYSLQYEGSMSDELFLNYVLNPRVEYEIMTAYRQYILSVFTEEEAEKFRKDPTEIWKMIQKQITDRPDRERDTVMTTPVGCLKYKIGSERSQKVLFVAVARTFGIPARLNPEDLSMEYWDKEKEEFVAVIAAQEKDAAVKIVSGDNTEWVYLQNWSLGCWNGRTYVSLNYEGTTLDQEMTIPVQSGKYRLITRNRLPNGNQLARQTEFEVLPGETKTVELVLRQADLKEMLERISVPEFMVQTEEKAEITASSVTEGKSCIMFWLEEGREPTEHILNEILEQKEEFAAYADSLRFVVRSEEALKDGKIKEVLDAVEGIGIYYDDFSENVNMLGRRMYVDPDKLPLIIVFDGSLTGIYATSGYNVGTGTMLLRILECVGTK